MFLQVVPSIFWKRDRKIHFTHFKKSRIIISYSNMSRTCLSQTTFAFQSNFYKQFHVRSMGSPLLPIFSDMHYFEGAHFNKFSLPFWTHYVDDTFTLIDISLHNIHYIDTLWTRFTAIFNLLMNQKKGVNVLFYIPLSFELKKGFIDAVLFKLQLPRSSD